jgi:glycosyltransferase involved in cell wall biosynthesis
LSFAKGELFAVLDADDVWLPEKLSVQCGIMKSFPEIAMICEASLYWNSWSDDGQKDEVILVGTGQDMVYYPPELLKVLYPLSEAAAPCPSGLMIRADKFRKHGGFEEHFRGKYQLYEDQAFLHKMYLNEPVYISSCCNNKYRQRIGSLVQKISQEGNYHVVRQYFLEWLEQYMKQNGIAQKNLNDLVSRALKPYRYPNTFKIINFLTRVKKGLHRRLTGNQLC